MKTRVSLVISLLIFLLAFAVVLPGYGEEKEDWRTKIFERVVKDIEQNHQDKIKGFQRPDCDLVAVAEYTADFIQNEVEIRGLSFSGKFVSYQIRADNVRIILFVNELHPIWRRDYTDFRIVAVMPFYLKTDRKSKEEPLDSSEIKILGKVWVDFKKDIFPLEVESLRYEWYY